MNTFLDTIWLVPLFPAFGAVLMVLAGRRFSQRAVSVVCVGLVLLSLIWSVGAVIALRAQPAHRFEQVIYTWFPDGPQPATSTQAAANAAREHTFGADVGFLLDPLSAVMILTVTGVGFLIHLYSIGYMAHDADYYRYFGFLNLFMFAMLLLVLADNYLMLFAGWEGVGLCSYLLIGFWFEKISASSAGLKAFLVNRVGDAGFIIGILTIGTVYGTLRFTALNGILAHGTPSLLITAATLLLFWGAVGKSAQLPLHVWLPDAMEGPTPVSALIHAATMVTAGVYMVCRSSALFTLSPVTMKLIAIVGCLTAVFAASVALVQTDIKRVLAYSTISQLGYMFLACGVGAFAAGLFHLVTHAFFKALLFLAAGSVIHAMSGEQDMRRMGALKGRIPVTFRTMFIAALAIAGVPPLAGFVSKDLILGEAWAWAPDAYKLLWIFGVITAGLTAFYIFRLVFLSFYGESRVSRDVDHHIHESPRVMTVPLIVLAGLSIVGGAIGWPRSLGGPGWLSRWVEPVFSASASDLARAGGNQLQAAAAMRSHGATEYGLMLASVVIGLLGIYVAYRLYVAEPWRAAALAQRFRGLHGWLMRAWRIDDLYRRVFVDGVALSGGSGLAAFDSRIVDGGINGTGWMTRAAGRLSIWWDTWIIDGLYVNGLAGVTKASSHPVRAFQTGVVQNYALLIVMGIGACLLYYFVR